MEHIIITHMRAAVDAESRLLQVATAWDVAGRRPEEFSEASRRSVLDRYPRLDFATEFLASFADRAQRKPSSAAAQSIASGGHLRILAQPLDARSSRL